MKIKYLLILLAAPHLKGSCCQGCQTYKTSWCGVGWPNLFNRPCRQIDAFGREGRYYQTLNQLCQRSQS